MDDAFSDLSLKDGEIWSLLLILFDLIVSRNIINDAIYPDCLNVGDMGGLNLICNIVGIALIDLFLP